MHLRSFAYVVFAQALTLTLLLEPRVAPAAVIAYLFVLAVARRGPLVLVLRSSDGARDYPLVTQGLALSASLARLVWLIDPRFEHPLLAIKRTTPHAFFCYFFGTPLVAALVYVNLGSPVMPIVPAVLLTWIITIIFVEGMAGGSRVLGLAALFVAAALRVQCDASRENSLIEIALGSLGAGFAAAVVFWILARTLFPSLAHETRRTLVRTQRDLIHLQRECRWMPRAMPRYILNAPVLVHEITAESGTEIAESDAWKATVGMLIDEVRVIVADLGGIRANSGLAWEIQTVARRQKPLILLGGAEVSRADVEELIGTGMEYEICAPVDLHTRLRAVLARDPQRQ